MKGMGCPMKKFDTIDLEIIPKEEMNGDKYYPHADVCTFVINGKRALDLINEFYQTSHYSYMTPLSLYIEMTSPWYYEDEAETIAYYPIVCCKCGEVGCDAIGVKIKRQDDIVEWYDISNFAADTSEGEEDKICDLTFRFKATEYDTVMKKLQKLAGK